MVILTAERALRVFLRLAATATGGGWLGRAYGLAGRTSEARKILNDLKARSKQTYVSPVNIAMIYLGLGDKGAGA